MKADTFDATYDNGGLIAQPFKDSDKAIVPVAVQKEYATVIKDLASGKITLPKSEAHPCCK